MKKKILAFILYYSGLIWLKLLYMRIFGARNLRILCYHRVMDIDYRHFEFDDEVVDAAVADFDRQMRFVARHFNVIGFKELEEYKRRGIFPKNSLIVTFDDGYKDFYTNAYPVLKRYKMPATIFLTTGHIGTNRLFWWDKLAFFIKNTPKKEISITHNGNTYKYDLSTYARRQQSLNALNRLMKKIKNEEREVIIGFIEKSAGIKIDPSATKDMILSWEDIKTMSNNSIEFGAHSVTHPLLSYLPPAKIEREIFLSKKKIEQQIKEPVAVFAYPCGVYNEMCKEAVKKAGFAFGCTYTKGVNNFKTDSYELKRIGVNYTMKVQFLKVLLVFPGLMNL